MLVIRTAEEMACALEAPPDPILHTRLTDHWERLQEYADYALEELATFLIVQPGDTAEDINAASPVPLVQDAAFTFVAEAVDQQIDVANGSARSSSLRRSPGWLFSSSNAFCEGELV
jgi:hypothetical protein